MRVRRSRFPGLSRSHLRLAAGAIAGLGLMVAGVSMIPDRISAARPHSGSEGTIRLAPDSQKLCQRLSFDNRNGEFRDKGVSQCDPQGGSDTTSVDRMQAIRAWFNRR
ncbi:hypothetical protein [Rhodoplanes roseus]|uniref:Uncharacterized protein n=1 Tax=Rhodoplanes roseus TaxID=29409 RepID=A0A327L1U4_9BRAD|nr:hypothetical protein [Rhodoplanes roseus]RAI43452.1 hypothetical protein CH341_14275 [Rhodoplanes roseus]